MVRALGLALLAAAIAVGAALAQGAGERPRAKPLRGLPAYTAGYLGWRKLNRAPIPPRESGDAHLGTKNVYVSRRAVRGRYPVGTVIVKEARRPGSAFVRLIAVMRKVKGANPEHRDWVMIEWVRDTRSARFAEIARGSVCTSCHVGARENDYVFSKR